MSERRAKKLRRRRKRKEAKRKQDVKRLQKPRELRMYIDESGNSDLNIFDEEQPSFFSFGLLSGHDLTTIETLSNARTTLEVAELHGTDLGLTHISTICSLLIDIIHTYNLRFWCSEIHKLYFGKMKFFDTIFDSGTNPGASSCHCFTKPLKYLLMIRFAEVVTLGELRHFWAAYRKGDVPSFKGLMEQMIGRVEDYGTDQRTRELLFDCYKGAILAPEDVLCYRLVKQDSPNVTSVVMFIHELNKLFDGQNILINEVVHDAQEQFGICIEEAYRIVHQVRIMWNIADFKHKRVKVFSPTFTSCDSKSCDGLQLADVLLYIHKQAISKTLRGEVATLYELLRSRMHCLFMTKEGLWGETERELAKVYSKPLRIADCKKGARLLEELESKRKAALLEQHG